MTTRLCSYCHKPYEIAEQTLINAAPNYAPFCSKRCSDVDLAHWLKGEYSIDDTGSLSLVEANDEASHKASPDTKTRFNDEDEVF